MIEVEKAKRLDRKLPADGGLLPEERLEVI